MNEKQIRNLVLFWGKFLFTQKKKKKSLNIDSIYILV